MRTGLVLHTAFQAKPPENPLHLQECQPTNKQYLESSQSAINYETLKPKAAKHASLYIFKNHLQILTFLKIQNF